MYQSTTFTNSKNRHFVNPNSHAFGFIFSAAGPYVTLTVRPPDMIGMPGPGGVGLVGGNGGRPHHVPTPHERTVTAPLPVDVSYL